MKGFKDMAVPNSWATYLLVGMYVASYFLGYLRRQIHVDIWQNQYNIVKLKKKKKAEMINHPWKQGQKYKL